MANEESGYVTWDSDESRATALASMSKALDNMVPIQKSHAALDGAGNRMYQGIDTNTSVRSGFDRFDYEFFRPGEATPRRIKDIIGQCMMAYQNIGILHNIIDLMGDFASQGIRIVHPNPATEKFYREWFKQVKGIDRSERFLNLLYRIGNVIVKRNTAKLKSDVADQLRRGLAAPDLKPDDPIDPNPGEIPWSYFFLNPLTLDVISNDLAAYANQYYFGLTLPPQVINTIKNPKNQFEKKMKSGIPKDILNAIGQEKRVINLDPDKIRAYYYKKDDWQSWAFPMTLPILKDLLLFEKMKLADLAALDGAISRVRLWRLGSLDHKILPTDAAIAKLSNILMNTAGNGSVIDLIWGPEIEFQETSTDVQKFLGSAKYEPVLSNIYAGLGIPPSLTGMGSATGGAAQNFITIRTFIEKLQYGRQILTDFWTYEMNIVRKAMMKYKNGFSEPAQIMYDHMDLTDEYAQRKLLIDLVDRDIIAIESVQEEFGRIPEIEDIRLKREIADRSNTPKVSPYVDAQPKLSLDKIALQRGVVTPGEIGMELSEKPPGQVTPLDVQLEGIRSKPDVSGGPQGKSGQGRPKNSKDKEPRKTRTAKSDINLIMWTQKAQALVSETLTPVFKEQFAKSNVRKFSESEHDTFENFKFGVLCNIEPFANLTAELIYESASKPFNHHEAQDIYESLIGECSQVPAMDEKRQIQMLAYIEALDHDNI